MYENLWKCIKIHENHIKTMTNKRKCIKSVKIIENQQNYMKMLQNVRKLTKNIRNLWKSVQSLWKGIKI